MHVVSFFNQLLSALLAPIVIAIATALSPYLPKLPKIQLILPPINLENSSPSAVVSIPKSISNGIIESSGNAKSIPWGQTEKLGPGLYRTYVGADPVMGTPQEILAALNSYRRNHNVGQLSSDDKICHLAQTRADQQEKLANLDEHKGLIEYMNDPNHWKELDLTGIGENASYGYVLSGVHLIEWVFDADVEHRDNQLNPDWTLACAGISGVTVDIIFGKR